MHLAINLIGFHILKTLGYFHRASSSPLCPIPPAGNPSSLSCVIGGLQPHVNSGGGQMYPQPVHQGLQQGAAPHQAYQGQQHFSENPSYQDGNSASTGSMACLYQNYQVG